MSSLSILARKGITSPEEARLLLIKFGCAYPEVNSVEKVAKQCREGKPPVVKIPKKQKSPILPPEEDPVRQLLLQKKLRQKLVRERSERIRKERIAQGVPEVRIDTGAI